MHCCANILRLLNLKEQMESTGKLISYLVSDFVKGRSENE